MKVYFNVIITVAILRFDDGSVIKTREAMFSGNFNGYITINGELYPVFNKYNINVPFPQVTVSYLDGQDNNDGAKKETTDTDKADQ